MSDSFLKKDLLENFSNSKHGLRRYLSERYTRKIVRAGMMDMNEETDSHAVRELSLHLDNTQELYNQKLKVEKKLYDFYKAGKYNPNLAMRLWRRWVDMGALHYTHEYGTKGDVIFSKQDREDLAKSYADDFFDAMKNNTDDLQDYSDV